MHRKTLNKSVLNLSEEEWFSELSLHGPWDSDNSFSAVNVVKGKSCFLCLSGFEMLMNYPCDCSTN